MGRMFLAGVVPGLVLGFMLMFAVWWRAGKLKLTPPRRPAGAKCARCVNRSGAWRCWASSWAASMAGSSRRPRQRRCPRYALGVAVFIYRDLKIKRSAARVSGSRPHHRDADVHRGQRLVVCACADPTERILQTIAEQIWAWAWSPGCS